MGHRAEYSLNNARVSVHLSDKRCVGNLKDGNESGSSALHFKKNLRRDSAFIHALVVMALGELDDSVSAARFANLSATSFPTIPT